jgi:hypothetical protein
MIMMYPVTQKHMMILLFHELALIGLLETCCIDLLLDLLHHHV